MRYLMMAVLLLSPAVSDAASRSKTRHSTRTSKTTPKTTPKTAPKAASKPAAKPSAKLAIPKSPATAKALPVSSGDHAASLASLGVALSEEDENLSVVSVLPGSQAEKLKLQPNDALAFLDRAQTTSAAEAAAAYQSWTPGTRLSAVVRRGHRILTLEGPDPASAALFSRGVKDLSSREQQLRDDRLAKALAAGEETLRHAQPLDIQVPARQAFWLRFPKGISANAAVGDVLTGEVTTAVSTDGNLDFLALPPGSLVWAKVLEVKTDAQTRQVRLFVYKIRPAGGHTYAAAGRMTAVSGDQRLAKVSAGGTLVAAAPVSPPGAKPVNPAKVDILDREGRLRVELTDPITISEPAKFYQAGPGLWLKTRETPKGRRFEVSHVIAGRAAEKAGLKVGQTVTAVAGKSTALLEFDTALGSLYGEPGSTVKVSVIKKDGGNAEIVELKRGVTFKDAEAIALPLPYEKKG